jgi:hypothetical protein
MFLNELLPRLQADHHHDLQAVTNVQNAIAEVERGLNTLARYGHVLHLEYGPAYHMPEWPMVLFHVTSAPNGRVVRSSWEALELGPGWWPTLQDAQYKEGIRMQFRGRGGVGDRSLPMLQDGDMRVKFDPDAPSPPKDNRSIIDEWKRTVRGTSGDHAGTSLDGRPSEESGAEPSGSTTTPATG